MTLRNRWRAWCVAWLAVRLHRWGYVVMSRGAYQAVVEQLQFARRTYGLPSRAQFAVSAAEDAMSRGIV